MGGPWKVKLIENTDRLLSGLFLSTLLSMGDEAASLKQRHGEVGISCSVAA